MIGLPDADVAQIIALSYESADLLNGLLSVAEMGPLAEAAGALERVPHGAAPESARRPA